MEFLMEGKNLEAVRQEIDLILAIKPEDIFEEHKIPEIVHTRINNLCDTSFFLKTKATCAKSVFENSLREGDHEKAMQSYEENKEVNKKLEAVQKDIWETIYKVCPKVDRNKVWSLDRESMKVHLSAKETIERYITKKLGLAAKMEGFV